MIKEVFNRKRYIFFRILEKELRKILVKCFGWTVALHGVKNIDIKTECRETTGII